MKPRIAVADLGNSVLKVALFEGDRPLSVRRFPWRDRPGAFDAASRWLKSTRQTGLHLISVNPGATRRLSAALKKCSLRLCPVPRRLPKGILSRYDRTAIGMDRLANIAAARCLYRHKNILVFDSGTALTCEIIEDRLHAGGFIAAGFCTLLSALHDRTGKLPRVVPRQTGPVRHPALSTRPAMAGGAWLEFSGGAEAAARLAEKRHGARYFLVVTGGGADPFAHSPRKRIRNPLLTLQGVRLLASGRK